MEINISRERWVVIRNNDEILCGIAGNFHFNPLEDVKNTAIKTYLSENKAMASFISSWTDAKELIDNGFIRFTKVNESIRSSYENIYK